MDSHSTILNNTALLVLRAITTKLNEIPEACWRIYGTAQIDALSNSTIPDWAYAGSNEKSSNWSWKYFRYLSQQLLISCVFARPRSCQYKKMAERSSTHLQMITTVSCWPRMPHHLTGHLTYTAMGSIASHW